MRSFKTWTKHFWARVSQRNWMIILWQEARSESLVLDIEDADLMADRRQDGHKLAIDVTGYTVQLRTSGQDWETAQQTVFDRSEYINYAHFGVQYFNFESKRTRRQGYFLIYVTKELDGCYGKTRNGWKEKGKQG